MGGLGDNNRAIRVFQQGKQFNRCKAEIERHEDAGRYDLLDDFHFGLFTQVTKLMLRAAFATSHIDPPFLRDTIVFLIDAHDFSFECDIGLRAQTHLGGLSKLQSAG